MFSVFLYFFHSDLVQNSAILSSDSCERNLFSAWRWSISLWLAASFSIKLYGLLINLVSDQIYHPIDVMLLTYSKYSKRQLVMKNQPGDWSQSEKVKCFE